MPGRANADQIDFWNDGPGRHWVTHAEDLDTMHRGALDVMLAAAAPMLGETVLDLGCGGGASTLELARKVAPGGRVTGLDVAAPLLQLARERAARAGVANAEFVTADAQVHPFEPDHFDLVTSRFGVMFFDDPVAAFANIASAMKPGGRLVFVAWSGADRNWWFRAPLDIAVALAGPRPGTTDPDAPGPMAFRDAARVTGILERAGLSADPVERVPFELHHPGGIDALCRIARHVGPLPRYIRDKQLSEATKAAIYADLARALLPYRTADGVRVPAEVGLFRARRP